MNQLRIEWLEQFEKVADDEKAQKLRIQQILI